MKRPLLEALGWLQQKWQKKKQEWTALQPVSAPLGRSRELGDDDVARMEVHCRLSAESHAREISVSDQNGALSSELVKQFVAPSPNVAENNL